MASSSSPAVGASSCPITHKLVLLSTYNVLLSPDYPITVEYSDGRQREFYIHKLYRGTVLRPCPEKGPDWFAFDQTLNVDGDKLEYAHLPNIATMHTLSIDERIPRREIDMVGRDIQSVIRSHKGLISHFIGLNDEQLENMKKIWRTLSPNTIKLTPIEDINREIEAVAPLFSIIDDIIARWTVTMSKPTSSANSSCAIAGGRRRPKKSRRSRSSRKRRQTRSK